MRTRYWLPALILGLGVLLAAPAADEPRADAERIARLIKQLGNDDFEEREKAVKDLEAIGSPALPALREAARGGDVEVKARATALVHKMEGKALSAKVLAPTKVTVVFKDTPLAEAVAEFSKKSGYTLQLHDPDNKLKDRKVTLDTGEVTFWEAFDKFCDKAGLVEASWQELMLKGLPGRRPGAPGGGILPPPPPINPPKDLSVPPEKKPEGAAVETVLTQVGGNPPAPPPVAPLWGAFGLAGDAITLTDGKPKSAPTCYSGSARIRVLKDPPALGFGGLAPPGGLPGAPPAAPRDDTTVLWLELRAEPKVKVQFVSSVRVEKATDDEDQKLEQPAPAAAPGGLPGAAPPGGGAARMMLPAIGMGGAQSYPVPLKRGEKEAKALKEFAGTMTAQVMAPAEAVITAEKITKAAGETFKGPDGGYVKVVEVKEEDGKLTVKFELEIPPGAMPAPVGGAIGMPGFGPGGVIPPPPPPAKPPAAPGGAGLAFQAPAPAVAGGSSFLPAPGVTLVDDKGKTIAQTGGAPPKYQFAPGKAPIVEYTQEYKLDKDQKPAKLVFSVTKAVSLDIPFSFKDVPLK
jgi:hypothetical protein